MALQPPRNEVLLDADRDRQDQQRNTYPYRNDGFYYHNHGPGLLGLSIEEIKVIRDCQNEANFKWALPGALISGGLAFAAANRRTAARVASTGGPGLRGWTVFWIVSTTALVGNFIGRLAYAGWGGCQDKMAALPDDSHIGQTARKLNAAGVRLPPWLIVAGAESGPWSQWGGPWSRGSGGYGSGYRWMDQQQGRDAQRAPEDSRGPPKF